MRTEAEIQEAIRQLSTMEPIGVPVFDECHKATIEAMRYCLGIDDKATCKMQKPLAEVIDEFKRLNAGEEPSEQSTVTE